MVCQLIIRIASSDGIKYKQLADQGEIVPEAMKILVSLGTYERVVYGVDFDLETSNAEDIKCISSKDSFAVPAHIASVRSVASCKKYLVSGSTDETIK